MSASGQRAVLKNALRGAASFGLPGVVAAYVWTTFEFPFAIAVPAFIGWYVVIRSEYGSRAALRGGTVGGIAFTAAFLIALFFAITDGSPIELTAGMSAALAAAAAGALTGWVLGGPRPSLALAGFSAAGMVLAVTAAGLLRSIAPDSVNVEGPAQSAYFALAMGIVATIVGASAGAGVSRVKSQEGRESPSR